MFDGNKGMHMDILNFFADIFISYPLLVLIKKIYFFGNHPSNPLSTLIDE